MPDSLTKFKENPPAKKVISGGSSGGGSGDGGEVIDPVVEFFYPQWSTYENGILGASKKYAVLEVESAQGFSPSTVIKSSSEMDFGGLVTFKGTADVQNVNYDPTSSPAINQIVVEIDATVDGNYFEAGDFVALYNAGTLSSPATRIKGVSYIYPAKLDIRPTVTFDNVPLVLPATGVTFSIAPTLPLGVAFNTTTGRMWGPVAPFTLPAVDLTNYEITACNGPNLDEDCVKTNYAFGTNEISLSTFAYNPANTYRVEIPVEDASGFVVSGVDPVFTCATGLTCTPNKGTGFIYFVDTEENKIFVTVGNPSRFEAQDNIMQGGVSSKIAGQIKYLFTPTQNFSLSPTWASASAPTGVTFTVTPTLPAGVSLNPSTGVLTGTQPLGQVYNQTYTVSAKNAANAGTSQTATFTIMPVPTQIAYGVTNIVSQIGDPLPADATLPPVITGALADDTFFTVIDVGTGLTAVLPSGLSFTSATGEFTGTPSAYSDGTTTYRVSAFHPLTGAAAFDTEDLTIKTATKIPHFSYPQDNGSTVIAYVDDTNNFQVCDDVISNFGGKAVVTDIDTESSPQRLFLQINGALSGVNVFKKDDELDISSTAFSNARATISKVTHSIDIASAFAIAPSLYNATTGTAVSLQVGESLSYAIAPSLSTGLSFNTTNGTITAAGLQASAEREYAVCATNFVGNQHCALYGTLISEQPRDLSYGIWRVVRVPNTYNNMSTHFKVGSPISSSGGARGKVVAIFDGGAGLDKALIVSTQKDIAGGEGIDNSPFFSGAKTTVFKYSFIHVRSTTSFTAGENISSNGGARGSVERVDSTNNLLYVKVTSGTFANGQNIDDQTNFATTETTITHVNQNNNVDMVLTASSTAAFTYGGYVSTVGGGSGIVVFKSSTQLAIRRISGQFDHSTQLDDTATYSAAVASSTNVISPIMQLTVGSSASFEAGDAIVANNGSHQGNGTVFSVDSATVMQAIHENGTLSGMPIDDVNPFVGAATTVTTGSSSPTYLFYTNEEVNLSPYIKAVGVIYDVTPTLPQGLELDSTTGVISGTPILSTPAQDYTISAKNDAGTSLYTVSLRVMGQFRVENNTTTALSYRLHKEGRGLASIGCRITEDQIGNSSIGPKDINCYLDAGELDLYATGLKLLAKSSGGACAHVQYAPFYFLQFQPRTTSATYAKFNKVGTCASFTGDAPVGAADANPTSACVGEAWNGTFYDLADCSSSYGNSDRYLCRGDYSRTTDIEGAPNCDPGDYNTIEYTCTEQVEATTASGTLQQITYTAGEAGSAGNITIQYLHDAAIATEPLVSFGGNTLQIIINSGSSTIGEIIAAVNASDSSSLVSLTPNAAGTTTQTAPANVTLTGGADESGTGICDCEMEATEDPIECNGASVACIQGPIRDVSELSSDAALKAGSRSVIYNASSEEGLSQSVDISSPMSKGFATNLYLANYTPHNNSCAVSGTYTYDRATWRTTAPAPFYDATTGRNPFYVFRCLDGAYNTKAQIHLMVRDWNAEFNVTSNIDQSNPGATLMDLGGNDPFGQAYNSRFDWTDLAGFGGTCAAPTFGGSYPEDDL
jgi:hypothetical protein